MVAFPPTLQLLLLLLVVSCGSVAAATTGTGDVEYVGGAERPCHGGREEALPDSLRSSQGRRWSAGPEVDGAGPELGPCREVGVGLAAKGLLESVPTKGMAFSLMHCAMLKYCKG